ncbi:MAG: hypothetical protein LC797_10990, partial [Chloroflexi bacterium]|nr:hypothetical protein [Chloroflexota bacterium]
MPSWQTDGMQRIGVSNSFAHTGKRPQQVLRSLARNLVEQVQDLAELPAPRLLLLVVLASGIAGVATVAVLNGGLPLNNSARAVSGSTQAIQAPVP